VQQEDELDSVDDFVRRVLQYNPLRDPVQVRGSIMHNLKQLPNGKWTWKYGSRFRRPGGRRFEQDPDMTARLWGYMESLACPTLVVRGAQSDIIALDTGCVWGRKLTAFCLETGEQTSVPAMSG